MTSTELCSRVVLLAGAVLAAGCSSQAATVTTGETDATGTDTTGGSDTGGTDYDPIADGCLRDEFAEPTRLSCLAGLAVQCEAAASAADCVGAWSAEELDVLGPLEVGCRWHPEAALVRAVADACEVVERASMCLGVVLTNDPVDPVGDPRCDPFGPLSCDGGVQSGRPHARRVSNTDSWLVKPVECGAILGFETDVDRCYGDDPATACGCFCE